MGKFDEFTDKQLEAELERRKSKRIREASKAQRASTPDFCKHGGAFRYICFCDYVRYDCKECYPGCYCM